MPRGFGSDGEISLDTRQLSALARDLRTADRSLHKDLLKRVRIAAVPIREAIAAQASWSSRIPGALAVRSSYAVKGASVKVIVDARKAPEGRPLNNRDRPGTFRHPVYADPNKTRKEWTWVDQKARPFMRRGAELAMPAVVREISKVYDDVASAAGYRR